MKLQPWDSATLYYAAHNALFPLHREERLSPAERKQRERAEVVARLRAPGGQGHC